MTENAQTKAKRLVTQYYNDRPSEGLHKRPISIKDVRVLFWRNVIQDNIWTVVCWTQAPEPVFYIVIHDKDTLETTINAYFMYETRTFEKGA